MKGASGSSNVEVRYSPDEYLNASGDMFVGRAFLFTEDVVEVVDTVEKARSRRVRGATLESWSILVLLMLLDGKCEGFVGGGGSWDDSGAA